MTHAYYPAMVPGPVRWTCEGLKGEGQLLGMKRKDINKDRVDAKARATWG